MEGIKIAEKKISHQIPQKLNRKSNYLQKIISKKSIIFQIIFVIISIFLLTSLSLHLLTILKRNSIRMKNIKLKRNLENKNCNNQNGKFHNLEESITNNENNNEDDKEKKEIISFIIIIVYALFVGLSLYIGCKLKSLSKSDEQFYDVLKYIYMTNNGYLLLSLIIHAIMPTGFSLAILMITLIIFAMGTAVYLFKFCKVIFQNFFEYYFSCEMYKSWLNLPDAVCKFLQLTDPCCYIDPNGIVINQDGTISNNKAFYECWNKFMRYTKILDLVISAILFYIFLLALIFPWGLIKILHFIIKKIIECYCKKIDSNSGNIQPVNNINQNNIIPTGFTGNNNVNTIKKGKTKKKYKKNKSQIIQNNIVLQDSNNHVENVNNINRRQSLNLNLNLSQLQNGTSGINKGNDIENQDV